MAFASPALDWNIGRLSSLGDVAGDVAARLQTAAALFARQAKAVLASRFGTSAATVKHTPSASIRSVTQAARPMTLADQWSKVTAVLSQSVDGARIATEMQSAATQQLDLAQYGLITLVDELAAVMAIPGRRSRSATVHALNGGTENVDPPSLHSHALAA